MHEGLGQVRVEPAALAAWLTVWQGWRCWPPEPARRLRPLTLLRPKPLCPVGDRPLLDHGARCAGAGRSDEVAVNVHHGRRRWSSEHLERWRRRPRSACTCRCEARPVALGTAGRSGHLRGDGSTVVTCSWSTPTPGTRGSGVVRRRWDGERVAVLTPTPRAVRPAQRCRRLAGAGADRAAGSPPSQRAVGGRVAAGGRARAARRRRAHRAPVMDCGTPARLPARPTWRGRAGSPTAAPWWARGRWCEGTLERCVVWPGSQVARGEHLVDAIRAEHLTVLVR